MKLGSWASILGVYLFAICGGSTLSKIIPIAGDLQQTFGLEPSGFGWLVAMMALPAAIFAIPSGVVVDKLGPRMVLLLAGSLGIAANAIYYVADSLLLIYAARLLEGFAVVHLYTAGPALIFPHTSGARRTRAMTLWSTYAPIGTALGLTMGGLFAESESWRLVFVFHAALLAFAILLGLMQPLVQAASAAHSASLGQRVTELFSAFRRPQLLSLGVVFLLIISLGVGTNVTFPVYFPVVHGLSAGEASNMVASATIIMVLGSALTGIVLPLGLRPAVLMTILGVLGFVSGTLCFYPGLSVELRMIPLIAWYILTGASLATVHATLPLVADPERPGAAAALLNFAGAVAAFINPPLWLGIFQSGTWQPFIALLAGFWAVAVLMIWAATRLARKDAQPGASARTETA
jgi:predicted MFS family arabinose efflux permease